MELHYLPQDNLALKSLPIPLRKAIHAIFSDDIDGCALVGGTALAGYYACHRKSNDLDLFTRDDLSHRFAIAAVKRLADLGARFDAPRSSPTYFHTLVELDEYHFTIDVVLDSNIHRVGGFIRTIKGVYVADLKTLQKMKVAALVSRCSEKDLYDLLWLDEHYEAASIEEFILLGQDVDAGVDAESLLISLCGVQLRESACQFFLDPQENQKIVFQKITAYKSKLTRALVSHLEKSSQSEAICALLKKLRKWL